MQLYLSGGLELSREVICLLNYFDMFGSRILLIWADLVRQGKKQ